MGFLLRKIKLIDYIFLELNIDKNTFIKKFQKNIDKSNLGYFSSFFEMFSSSKKNYKGFINYNEFKIRKRHRFFEGRVYHAVTKGTFTQKGNTLLIKAKISGSYIGVFIFYIIMLLFYSFFIFSIYTTSNKKTVIMLAPFIFLHALLMFIIPLYRIRKGIKNTKKDLEKEFLYILNK